MAGSERPAVDDEKTQRGSGKQGGGVRRAFSHRNFAVYTSGNFPSQVGVWAQRVAIGWLAWQMTGSPFMLGLLGFADMIPVILLNPIAGYVTDRFDRLWLAKIIQLFNVAVTASLAALAYLGLLNIELLLLFAFLTGIDHALFQPVRTALTSSLVPRHDLTAAIAIGGFSWNSARFIGPALGGLMLKVADADLVFLINAVLYLWFYLSLFLLRLAPQPPRAPSGTGMAGEIMAGYRYALGHAAIGPLLVILACASFLTRPVVELLPGFAAAVFERGPGGLAWLTSAMGVGAMTSGMWIAQRGRLEGLPRITVHTLLLATVVLVVFASTGWFPLAVACMALVGFQYSLFATCIQTMIQSVADEHMRGRVLALYGFIWIGFAAFGSLAIGGLSELFGLRPPVAACGLACLLVWLWARRVHGRVSASLEAHGLR